MTTESERELRPLEVVWRGFEPILRSLAVAIISGAAAGLIAGGVGSRVAMRIVAITARDADQGAITDAQATVGEITAGGTIVLIVFAGIFAGAFGGLLYAATRRWLADAGRLKGLTFGLLLLAVFGSFVIESDNPDFRRFGSAELNVAMFAALFLLFGLLVAPLSDAVERWLPGLSLTRGGVVAGVAHGLSMLMLLPVLGLSIGGGGSDRGFPQGILPVYALLALPAGAFALSRMTGGFDKLSDLRSRPRAMALALGLVAVALAIGIAADVDALREIL